MSQAQMWLTASVAVYMGFMLWIGVLTAKKIKDTKDYIIAGGKIGWWLSIGTIFATWFGAETCMGSSRIAYEQGILGVIADPFGAGLCLLIAGIFFVRVFHNKGYETIVDFFEARYGRQAAGILSVLYLPVYLGWVGGQLLAFGLILNALTGLPIMPCILVSTAVVLFYTYTGGMWADAITDFYQIFLIIIGLLVLFPVVLHQAGGWQTVRAVVPDEFFHFYPHTTSKMAWFHYAQAWMIVGLGSLPAQDLFQRLMAPKSTQVAQWGAIISGVMYIGFGMIPVLLGIFGRAIMPDAGGDSILLTLAMKYLPLPLMALFVGALLSAIMSTADSALLAPAGIIGRNIMSYIRPGISEEMKLKWCRWSILIVGILSLILALYFKNIYTLCTNAWGILLVGVAAPMIAGVYWKRATAQGAIAAAGAGIVSWIVFSLDNPRGLPTQLTAFLISCTVLVFVSWVTGKVGQVGRA